MISLMYDKPRRTRPSIFKGAGFSLLAGTDLILYPTKKYCTLYFEITSFTRSEVK